MQDTRAPDYQDRRDESATPPPRDPSGRIAPVLEPNEARQGATHHNVRFVLAISLAVVVVAMAVAYFFFFPTSAPLDAIPPTEPLPAPAPQP